MNATTYAIRCIDKAGTFDNYLLFTKDKNLASDFCINLKRQLEATFQEKFGRPFKASEFRMAHLKAQEAEQELLEKLNIENKSV